MDSYLHEATTFDRPTPRRSTSFVTGVVYLDNWRLGRRRIDLGDGVWEELDVQELLGDSDVVPLLDDVIAIEGRVFGHPHYVGDSEIHTSCLTAITRLGPGMTVFTSEFDCFESESDLYRVRTSSGNDYYFHYENWNRL